MTKNGRSNHFGSSSNHRTFGTLRRRSSCSTWSSRACSSNSVSRQSWFSGAGLIRTTSSSVVVVVPPSDSAVRSAGKRIVSFERPARSGRTRSVTVAPREVEPVAQPLLEDLAGVLEVAALVELHQTSTPEFGGVVRTSTSPCCLRRIAAQVPSPQESWSSPQAWIPLIR